LKLLAELLQWLEVVTQKAAQINTLYPIAIAKAFGMLCGKMAN
jgi:hypothetical protein